MFCSDGAFGVLYARVTAFHRWYQLGSDLLHTCLPLSGVLRVGLLPNCSLQVARNHTVVSHSCGTPGLDILCSFSLQQVGWGEGWCYRPAGRLPDAGSRLSAVPNAPLMYSNKGRGLFSSNKVFCDLSSSHPPSLPCPGATMHFP